MEQKIDFIREMQTYNFSNKIDSYKLSKLIDNCKINLVLYAIYLHFFFIIISLIFSLNIYLSAISSIIISIVLIMNKNYLSIAVFALLNTSQASIHKYRPPKGREPWA